MHLSVNLCILFRKNVDSDGADSGSSSDVMIIAVESQPSEQEFSGYVAN